LRGGSGDPILRVSHLRRGDFVSDTLHQLFSSEIFLPHGHSYLWQPELLGLEALSNGLIALSYFALASALAYLTRSIRDRPVRLAALALLVFMVACGLTHLLDVWVIWRPLYWLDGLLRALAVLAAIGTVVALARVLPRAVALARAARAAHERGLALDTVVSELDALARRNQQLEQRVNELLDGTAGQAPAAGGSGSSLT
jgi:hypothetical protein